VISDLAFEGDIRGIREYRYISGDSPFRAAAKKISEGTGTVLILTGFYISRYESIETDGLTGTWVLVNALSKMGFNPILPVDQTTRSVFEQLFNKSILVDFPITDVAASIQNANLLLKTLAPCAVIAIERPGPVKDRYFNFNGDEITEFTSRMEYLFSENCLTVGIGDGGNELGTGLLAEKLSLQVETKSMPLCNVYADYTLLGSTSDFAAFGLAAAFEITGEKSILPEPESVRKFLMKTKMAGIVDGMTGNITASVDGFSCDVVVRKYTQYVESAKMLRLSQILLNRFHEDLKNQYGVSVCSIKTSWNAKDKCVKLAGYALNNSHIRILDEKFESDGICCSNKLLQLADPETRSPFTKWMSAQACKKDLFDRPKGKLTTEIAEYDLWIRLIWKEEGWYLLQTPDLAMGWSNEIDPEANLYPEQEINPWGNIHRPLTGKQIPYKLSIDKIHTSAEKLLDIPYRWGGRSLKGIDCSGMIQRIFMDQQLLLPRNSRNQRKCGIRIPLKNHRPGDLIFAVGRKKAIHHVAISLRGGIQHACLNENRVIFDSQPDFAEKYKVIAVRRIASIA